MSKIYDAVNQVIMKHVGADSTWRLWEKVPCLFCQFGPSIGSHPFWNELWEEVEKAGKDTKWFREAYARHDTETEDQNTDLCHSYMTADFMQRLVALPWKEDVRS